METVHQVKVRNGNHKKLSELAQSRGVSMDQAIAELFSVWEGQATAPEGLELAAPTVPAAPATNLQDVARDPNFMLGLGIARGLASLQAQSDSTARAVVALSAGVADHLEQHAEAETLEEIDPEKSRAAVREMLERLPLRGNVLANWEALVNGADAGGQS